MALNTSGPPCTGIFFFPLYIKFLSDHFGFNFPYFSKVSSTHFLKLSSDSGGTSPACSASHSGLKTQTPSVADLLSKFVFKSQFSRIVFPFFRFSLSKFFSKISETYLYDLEFTEYELSNLKSSKSFSEILSFSINNSLIL